MLFFIFWSAFVLNTLITWLLRPLGHYSTAMPIISQWRRATKYLPLYLILNSGLLYGAVYVKFLVFVHFQKEGVLGVDVLVNIIGQDVLPTHIVSMSDKGGKNACKNIRTTHRASHDFIFNTSFQTGPIRLVILAAISFQYTLSVIWRHLHDLIPPPEYPIVMCFNFYTFIYCLYWREKDDRYLVL